MTPAISDQLGVLAQQREQLDVERRRIQKAYCLAVLDHITAKVRHACPEAAYVGVAYNGTTRDVDLLGVLGEQTSPLSGLPWLWESSDEEHPLAEIAADIEADVQTALKPYDSPAWATIRANRASDGNLWLVELPPVDRAARIAQLVRESHPQATAVVVDGRGVGGRVIEVVEGVDEDGAPIRLRPRWTGECDDVLNRLVAQIFAIPDLADRHLVHAQDRYRHRWWSGTRDLAWVMPLPPAE
ncbi:hypothetical protein ACFY1U_28855 [Streptomyces sp. NPDC001351]|uniref:hypothetical protein n=1 Tax=Streptomyces sp. NPDC001351 TaxID=3364564 RepID=UPI00368CCE68